MKSDIDGIIYFPFSLYPTCSSTGMYNKISLTRSKGNNSFYSKFKLFFMFSIK